MGLEIGFNFYKKVSCDNENKTVQFAPVLIKDLDSNQNYIDFFNLNIYENTMFICGRNMINNKITDWIDNKAKGTYNGLVFDKNLNGYTVVESEEFESNAKLTSANLEEVYKVLNFDNVKNCHEQMIENANQQIDDLFNAIEIHGRIFGLL